MSLPGYDAWKTREPPEYEDEGEPDPDCSCYGTRSLRARRNCAVHGEDPDAAYERERDEQ